MNSNFERLENFTNGVGAARVLLQRSHEQGSLIEGLVLYATLVDGFCRIALVLKQQIENQSLDFDVKYIYQGDDKDYYSERYIYEQALKKGIVDQDFLNEVNALYDIRNKAIHQFLLTEIEYSNLELLLDRYELIYQRLFNAVYELESKQIYRGIGMTISRKITEGDKESVLKNILNKIDTKDAGKLQRIFGSKLVHESKSFSEKVERERISEEISEEIEIRDEKTRIPPGYASVKEITTWARRKGFFEKCVCDHEKIYHINNDQVKKGQGGIESPIEKCCVDGCKCLAYVNASEGP